MSKKKELQDICKWILDGNVPEIPCVVSGDFNHVDSEHPDEWNSFLSLLSVESTLQGKTTFVGPKGESSIDDVLVPTEYMQNSSLWPQVHLEHNYQQSGHATVGVELRHRPSVSSTDSFASHATIPSSVYQPGKDLMDFRLASHETDSVAKLIRRLHCTSDASFRNLQFTNARQHQSYGYCNARFLPLLFFCLLAWLACITAEPRSTSLPQEAEESSMPTCASQ